MNKKKYIAFPLMLSLLCINNVYADCIQEEIDEFKKIKDDYKVTYKFNKETKDYTLLFDNPSPDLFDYIIYIEGNIKCEDINQTRTESACYNIPIDEYKIEVVGITESCKDVFKTIALKLPKYNNYSEDPICEGIEEFVLCQPTYDKEIDYDTFVSRVNTYKKSKNKENIDEPTTKKEANSIEKIVQYIQENLINVIIITVFIILITISIIVTYKSSKKSWRLE